MTYCARRRKKRNNTYIKLPSVIIKVVEITEIELIVQVTVGDAPVLECNAECCQLLSKGFTCYSYPVS